MSTGKPLQAAATPSDEGATALAAGVFDAYGKYYDLLYSDKHYAVEANYIDDLLKRHSACARELLEFGSGTGRHGHLLAAKGYRVTGIERSARMAAQARPCEGFSSQLGDIRHVRLGRTFDAVISLFHVVSYQVSNDDVRALFLSAREHLQPSGLFIFDVWYSPAVHGQHPETRVKRVADETTELLRIAEPHIYPNANRVDVCYTLFAKDIATGAINSLTETHSMRHFSLPELDLIASEHGFERIAAEEFLTGKEPDEHTWSTCLVLRRT